MKNKRIKDLMAVVFIIAGLAVLKFVFDTPDLAIVYVLVIGIIGGLLYATFAWVLNLPDWLFRIRYPVMRVTFLIGIGSLVIGMEAIEGNIKSMQDIGQFFLILLVLGVVISIPTLWRESKWSKKRKSSIHPEGRLLEVDAQMLVSDREPVKGKLVLTNNRLVFYEKNSKAEMWGEDLIDINAVVNTVTFCKIPNGIKLENNEMVFRTIFPKHWIKRINQTKEQLVVV